MNLIFSFLPLFSNLHKLEENPPAVIRHNPRAVFNLDKDPLEHPSNRHTAQLHQKIFNLKPSEEHLVEKLSKAKNSSFHLGPLLSTVVFFLYTLVNLSINRSKRVSEVRVTVLPLASRIEKTVAGHSELCRIYLDK